MDALMDYCRRDAEITWRLMGELRREEARQRYLRAKVRRVTRRWEEDGILPLGLHDWRPPASVEGGS
jgi:hypothetical protein